MLARHNTPKVQSRPYRPLRWYDRVFLALVTLGLLLFILTVVPDIAAMPFGFAIAMTGLLIQVALFFAIFRIMMPPRCFPCERSDVISALLWGGLAATGAAGIVNSFGTGTIIAPFSEEFVKLLGVFFILKFGNTTVTVARGFVIGFLVGAAFEIIENFEYTVGSPEDGSAASTTESMATAAYRTFIGFGIHPMLVAISGAALAYVLTRHGSWLRMVSVLGAVIALHAVWDNAPEIGGASAVVLMLLAYVAMASTFVFTCRTLRRNSEREYEGDRSTPIQHLRQPREDPHPGH